MQQNQICPKWIHSVQYCTAKKKHISLVANKRFVSSKFKFKFPRARNLEIIGLVLGCIEAKFVTKYALESSLRDLHNALLCTV